MNTALPTIKTLSSIPRINSPLPGGVMGAFVPANDDHPAYLLVLAFPLQPTPKLAWGPYDDEVEGLSDWDGAANTKILAAGDHPAAKYCAEITQDGHADYFLASKRDASAIAAAASHLLPEGWYWTSSQYSSDGAFVQGFSDGLQHGSGKGTKCHVLAVRRIMIDSPLQSFSDTAVQANAAAELEA